MNFSQLDGFTASVSQSVSHVLRISSGARCATARSCFFVLIANCVLRSRFAHPGSVFWNRVTSENNFFQTIIWQPGQTRDVVQLTNLNEIQNRLHFAGNPQVCQRFSVPFQIPKTTRDHSASYSFSSLLLKPRISHPKRRVAPTTAVAI